VKRSVKRVSGNGWETHRPKLTMMMSLLGSLEQWGMSSGLSSRGREGGERGKQTYLKSLDDSVVVKAVDGVVLGKLALCENTVKEPSAGGELKREVVFCARLEALRRCCRDR